MTAEPTEIPTLDARVARLEEQMAAPPARWPRILRDFWMVVITGLVVLTLVNVNGTLAHLQRDGRALCAFREDLQSRVNSTVSFLATHPKGFAGIPASTLRVSLVNEEHTLKALSALVC